MAEKIEKGNFVQVHYTGTFKDGKTFDSSKGKDPLEVLAGQGMLIKGFDDALLDMAINEEKEIDIPADEAYGQPNKELVKTIPLKDLGADLKPEIGMTIGIRAPTGQVFPATIKEINDDVVVIDANHPLAGKDLHFKLKVVTTRKPTEEDLKKFAPSSCGVDGCETCDGC